MEFNTAPPFRSADKLFAEWPCVVPQMPLARFGTGRPSPLSGRPVWRMGGRRRSAGRWPSGNLSLPRSPPALPSVLLLARNMLPTALRVCQVILPMRADEAR